jgi:Domain of unknown function (DUF4124)
MKALVQMLTLMMCGSLSFAGDVYKWKDEQGNVHFSERPPVKKAESVEVKNYGKQNASIDKDVEELKNAMTNEIKKVDETDNVLNCSVALDNAQWQFQTMLDQGKRNLNNGSINQDQFGQVTAVVNKLKSEISYSDCQSAAGIKKSFYECMSNKNNHLVGCTSEHNF